MDKCANPDRAQLGALVEHQQATQKPKVYHMGVRCTGCGCRVYGIRYQCPICPSFDLCEHCETHEERRNMSGHSDEHALLKIRVPKPALEEEESFVIIGTAGPIGDNYDWK